MYCSNCGNKINDNERYCPYCGAEQNIDYTVPAQQATNKFQMMIQVALAGEY